MIDPHTIAVWLMAAAALAITIAAAHDYRKNPPR